MTLPAPAAPGQLLADIDTPALLLDLDRFERNLDRLHQSVAVKGVRVRPHAKSHKTPEIALRQMARGAVGVCCQKVSEAEAMVAGGVRDVLIANEVVGAQKLARLAQLAGRARMAVCVDDLGNVADLERAVATARTSLDVLVEVNVGAHRCGVEPGEPALKLASAIAASPHLHFRGLHAYHGAAQHVRAHADRVRAIGLAVDAVRMTASLLAANGLKPEIITGAGTGTYLCEAASGVYNEIQPGSYIFMDADYGRNLDESGKPVSEFEQSLTILATVMSHTTPERAAVDAGLKAHSVDSGMPGVMDLPGVEYLKASDEHGVLRLGAEARVKVGDKIRLIPGHCDPTVNLYDWMVCHRGDQVESVWPIAARGAFY
jgi:D-serine deaminase-like pyridoxal phosphate-dependent protein